MGNYYRSLPHCYCDHFHANSLHHPHNDFIWHSASEIDCYAIKSSSERRGSRVLLSRTLSNTVQPKSSSVFPLWAIKGGEGVLLSICWLSNGGVKRHRERHNVPLVMVLAYNNILSYCSRDKIWSGRVSSLHKTNLHLPWSSSHLFSFLANFIWQAVACLPSATMMNRLVPVVVVNFTHKRRIITNNFMRKRGEGGLLSIASTEKWPRRRRYPM